MSLSLAPTATVSRRALADDGTAKGVDLAPGPRLGPDPPPIRPHRTTELATPPLSPRSYPGSSPSSRSSVSGTALTPRSSSRRGQLEPLLLPFLDRPEEVRELLFSEASPECTQQTARRMTELFAGPAQGETLQTVLRAPRETVPDPLWIAGIHALLFPRSAEVWAKFAAAVGADTLDADEWRPALSALVAACGGDGDAPARDDLERAGTELARALMAGEQDKVHGWTVAPAAATDGAARGAARAVRSASDPSAAGSLAQDAGAGAASTPSSLGSMRSPRSLRSARDARHRQPVSLSLDSGLACVAEHPEEAS